MRSFVFFKKKEKKLISLNGCLKKEKRCTVRHPYSTAKKKFSSLFKKKIEDFTNAGKKLIVIWHTRKIQSSFNYKDKVQHHSFVVYRKSSSRGSD